MPCSRLEASRSSPAVLALSAERMPPGASLPALLDQSSRRVKSQLEQGLAAERARRHERLQRALDGKRYRRIERDLVNLTADLAHAERDGTRKAADWLAKRLDKHRRHVREMVRASKLDEPAEVHAVRKELKKYRYAAELARGAFASAPTKQFLALLSDVQDVLGAWNDNAVAEQWLERLLPGLPANTRAQAHQKLAVRLASERADNLRRLEKCLGALVHEEPFWKG